MVASNLSGGGVEESKPSQQQPCLLITDRREIQTHMFNSKPQLLYDVGGEIPEFLGRTIGCSFGEWVLLTGTTDNDVLVNLLSKEIIELPSLDMAADFCTITSHPYDPTCHIVYFSKEENALRFCQPGDKEFTIKNWDHEIFPAQLAVVAGKLFLYLPSRWSGTLTYTMGIIEFKESTYQFEVVEMDCETSSVFIQKCFFFEYSGELFLVLQIGGRAISKYVIGFEIFKADFLNKKWVTVKKLGGVALFIGYETAHVQGASVESGVAANSIYFLEDDHLDNVYIYNLREGTIRVKPTFFSMQMKTTKDTQIHWILMPREASFRILLKGDQEDSEKENKASVEVEEVGLQNSWTMVPPELLNLIQSHLFGRDNAVFHLVCKPWHQVSIRDYSIPALLCSTTLLELCQSSSPLFMFQEDLTISCDTVPIFRFFDPVHKRLYRTEIPDLRGTDIHYSRDGWLLVCRRSDDRSFFFFNPLTQEKIELPRIPSDILLFCAQFYSFSFSSLPTCSNCLVVGMQRTTMEIYTLKHGEETWRDLGHYEFEYAEKREYGHCPVVLHGLLHFMCDNRDMSTFYLNDGVEGEDEGDNVGENDGEDEGEDEGDNDGEDEGDNVGENDGEGEGQFLEGQSWSSKFKPSLRGEDFFLVIDEAPAFVCVEPDGGGISIFKWNYLKTEWELMEGGVNFRGKQMFLSKRGSFMEKIDDVGGLRNTIFLPMMDDAKEGVFYSRATRKYHTLYSGYSSELLYNVDKFLNGVWVKPDRKIVGEHNLKWFV